MMARRARVSPPPFGQQPAPLPFTGVTSGLAPLSQAQSSSFMPFISPLKMRSERPRDREASGQLLVAEQQQDQPGGSGTISSGPSAHRSSRGRWHGRCYAGGCSDPVAHADAWRRQSASRRVRRRAWAAAAVACSLLEHRPHLPLEGRRPRGPAGRRRPEHPVGHGPPRTTSASTTTAIHTITQHGATLSALVRDGVVARERRPGRRRRPARPGRPARPPAPPRRARRPAAAPTPGRRCAPVTAQPAGRVVDRGHGVHRVVVGDPAGVPGQPQPDRGCVRLGLVDAVVDVAFVRLRRRGRRARRGRRRRPPGRGGTAARPRPGGTRPPGTSGRRPGAAASGRRSARCARRGLGT